jgi:hypothetical protein
MIMNIVNPHIQIGIDLAIDAAKKFYDRHFSCDRRRTRQITQDAYEEVNRRPEFDFGSRYS